MLRAGIGRTEAVGAETFVDAGRLHITNPLLAVSLSAASAFELWAWTLTMACTDIFETLDRLSPMTTLSASQPTVLESILQWSVDRPNWQRDALRRIVEKGRLDDTDIAELSVLCIAERGLSKSAATAIPLERKHLPANPGSSDSVTLTEIRDITGVNHLASGQNLTFSTTGLTVVYGDNGSGKSGYARILKRICRTRNPGSEIMGNIYAPPGTPIVQNATIGYQVGGKVEAPFLWSDTGGQRDRNCGEARSACAADHRTIVRGDVHGH
jgi:hypothetical protein